MLEARRFGTGHNWAFGAEPSSWAGFGSVPAVELMTGRLLLRRPLEDDAVDALAMLQDPDVVRWNPAPAVVNVETAGAWCARGADWREGTHATWHAVDRSTGRLVANCSIFAIDRDQATAKIGYRVAPWHRRQGIGSEVTEIVTRWAFAELGLARVQLEHAVANVGSCLVASNAGFVFEGVLRSASRDGLGSRHDDHVHGRLATDPVPDLGATRAVR
jgi:RimJ/RimL family protein N-acetyltransferase